MAKMKTTKARVLYRWADTKTGYNWAVRSDRKILYNKGFGWKVFGTLKPDHTPESLRALLEKHPERYLIGTQAPSFETLVRWDNDGVAKATDGCRVEPDGTCPHGKPSWLLVRGLI